MADDLVLSSSAPIARSARLDTNPTAIYLSRLAPGSRRTMRQALNTMAGLLSGGRHDAWSCPWHELGYQHTQALRSVLAESDYKASTCNKMLAALRGVLKEAWRLGLMRAEEYHRAIDIPPVKGTTVVKGRALARRELELLLGVCNETPVGARNAALLAVGYACGLRRAEIVGLDLSDYDPDEGWILIREGKGNKDREVPLEQTAQRRLEAYLEIRGRGAGALFTRGYRGERLGADRLSDQGVRDICVRMAAAAGVPEFSPHDLRRTFITRLLDRGVDITTVQKLAGHANVTTTARYDRRGRDTMREAVQRLEL